MATINGTPEEDILRGTLEADSIFGLAGDDRLSGNQGSDRVFGGTGDDRVFGGKGSDRLGGGRGDDNLRGNQGSDRLSGGAGNDRLFGGIGNDRLNGGDGNDTLTGSSFSLKGQIDTLTGGAGSDLLILGDETQVFYDDRNSATAGRGNYALVTGFNTSDDLIQLNGTKNDYVLAESPNNLPGGTAIYLDKPEGADELIGIVQGSTNLSLDGDYFSFTDRGAPGAEFNLADLDGSNGFVISVGSNSSLNDLTFSNAGNVNGDGFDDIIIGASFADSNGLYNTGSSYVVFGKEGGFNAEFNVADLNGINGFKMNGINAGDYSGTSVSTAGDINGDGFDDLLIAAEGTDPNGKESAGSSYVVFGKEGGFDAEFNLSALNGSNGFVLNGINENDFSGQEVSTAGDINDDGFDDLIIGAHLADLNGQTNAGSSYVVFGKRDGFDASLNLSALNGSNGFVINGSNTNDELGSSVSTAGDVNGDGFDDLLIGSLYDPSYVVFGQRDGFDPNFNLADLDGSNGFIINVGSSDYDYSVSSLSDAGDINGDGLDDLIIGASGASPNGQIVAGSSYVVFGKEEGFDASLNLSNFNGSNGFVINGIDEFDRSGSSVSTAGDFNGDGFDDILIGAYSAAPNGQYSTGESYVVFGKGEGFDPSLNLSDLNGSNGFKINGIDNRDYSGSLVSTSGDVNGDGFDDIIIGRFDDFDQIDAAESYVIFGRADFTAAALNVGTLKPFDQLLASNTGNAVMSTGQNLPFGSTTTPDNIFFDLHNAGISPLLVGTDIT